MNELDLSQIRERVEAYALRMRERGHWASVLVPLLPREDGGSDVLFEVRAHDIDIQPGEVCFPGGHVEPGETSRQAAVRETCEELLISPSQIEILAELPSPRGIGNLPVDAFLGVLHDYEGTWFDDEVDHTFTLPLSWLLENEPDVWYIEQEPRHPKDFPWDKVPGGRAYPWRHQTSECPFYDTEPVIWGLTARICMQLTDCLRG